MAIALLAGITYYYTGSAGEATVITILFNATGTVAYYGLERLWDAVPWGRGRIVPGISQGDRESLNLSPGSTHAATPKRPVDTD